MVIEIGTIGLAGVAFGLGFAVGKSLHESACRIIKREVSKKNQEKWKGIKNGYESARRAYYLPTV